MAYKASAQAVYDLKYHIVWAPQYRQDLLVGEVAHTVQALFQQIAAAYDIEMATMEVMEDQVHLFLSAPPRYAPARIVHILKSISARELFARFPRLRRRLWGGQLWEDGYFVRSVGDAVTAEILRRYIRYQKHPQNVQWHLFEERSSKPRSLLRGSLLPADVESIANQGTVDAAETAPVQTDDPTTPAEDDPTETSLAGRGRIGDLVWQDLDGDGVRDTGEPGLANVAVELAGAGPDGRLDTADDVPFPAQRTDAAGAYAFTALRSGMYQVTVEATTLPAGSMLTTANVPLTVTLEAGATVDDADFGYQQQGRVSGRLFHDRNGDGGLDPDEPGLAGITVRLTDSQGSTQPVLTDAMGNYGLTVPIGVTTAAVDATTVPEGFVLTTNNAEQTVTVTGGAETATDPVGYRSPIVPVPIADLAILKTGPARIETGDTLTYTLTVRNAGPDAAVDLVITDPTPEGLTFLRADAPCRTGFPCTMDRLEVDADRIFTVSFRVPPDYAGPDPIRNTAAVASAVTDPDPSNNSITVATAVARPAQADLVLTKTGPPSTTRGSTVTYTLGVRNAGPDDAADVVLHDPTPRGLRLVTATGLCAEGFPCVLGTLSVDTRVRVQVTFAVPAAYAGPDPISNTARVASATTDPLPGNNTARATTPLGADTVDLTLTKTGPPEVTAGENVTYTLVVTNTGPALATEVRLDDPTPVALAFVRASAPCQEGFPCALGTLRVGEPRTVTVTFQVPTTYTGPNPVVNVAMVTSAEAERDPRDNSANAVTGIAAAAADLQLTKSGPTLVLAGERLTYTLVVTNAGPGTATDVSLNDPTPAPLELVAISAPCGSGFPCALGDLAAGSAVALTVTFQVPEPYTGPNPLTNTATVTSNAPDPDLPTNTGTAQTFVNVLPTGACLFQYRSLLAPTPGAPGGDQDGPDPEESDGPVDEGGTNQTTPSRPVLRLTTPQEGDVVTGTALAVAVAQAPVRTLTVSQLRSVTVANGAAPAQLDISEQPGSKTEQLTAGQAQVVITADRVVVGLPATAVRTNDVLTIATVATASAPGLLPGEVVGDLIALTLASGQETFQRPVTLRLPYTDADHDGVVDGTSPAIDVTALTLWFFDATTETWVQVPEALILPDVNSVTAPLTAVTVVGLFLADDGSQGQVDVDDAAARPVRSGNGNTRGSGWHTIGRTTSVPLVVAWNTTGLANGPYELRAVCAETPDALTVPAPPPSGADTPQGQGGGDSGCFIATAAFGSPLAPQVQVLRAIRDRYLLPTAPGRWLVQRYEAVSPALADAIRDRAVLRGIVRVGLTPVVWSVGAVMHGTGAHALLLLGFILLAGAGVIWRTYSRRWQR